MSDDSNSFEGTLSWDSVWQQVHAFRNAWQAGPEPAIEAFLPTGPEPLRNAALLELIKVDLSARGCDGACRVESYLERFPGLTERENDCLDLVAEEFRLRKEQGASVTVDEYCRRFPTISDRLRPLLGGAPIQHQTPVESSNAPAKAIDVGGQIDDFDLLLKLGEGSFATVYLARQRSMQRMVALKVSSDRGVEHLTLAQLDHPGIVRVYDQRILPAERVRLLYMQYVPGGTLETVVDLVRAATPEARTGGLLVDAIRQEMSKRGEEHLIEHRLRDRLATRSWGETVCVVGAQLAQALDYAHRKGVLHRDIKPANVLLGANATPRLADFNVSFSKSVEGDNAAEHFGGSLAYMPPEQIEAFDPRQARSAEDLDARSDVFALGVLLFELAAGERPFPDPPQDNNWAKTLNDMLVARRAGVAKTAWQILPSKPAGLRRVLEKCLAPDREVRFQSAGELARRFQIGLNPEVEEILTPPQRGVLHAATRAPLTALVVMGLIPNVLTSALSIAYNRINIINKLPDAKRIFDLQLVVVNPVAYGSATLLLLWLAAPVLTAVRNPIATSQMSAAELRERRQRCSWIGDYVAWVTAIEWTFSGLVFPGWLHIAKGEVMDTEHYLHFFSSQFLCGLIAATGAFFAISALATRVYYPRLLPDGTSLEDAAGREELHALGRRAWWYLRSTAAIFPLAVLTLVALDHFHSAKGAFIILSLVGLVYPFIAFWLMRVIQRNIAALIIAMSPLEHDGG